MHIFRMNRLGTGVMVSAICFALISCATAHPKTQPQNNRSQKQSGQTKQARAEWTAGMKRMAATLESLMPYAFSREEFSNPRNEHKVNQLIRSFAKNVKGVSRHAGEKLLGGDPIVKFAIDRLQTNANEAELAYREGHVEFARNVLRESMGLCFSCHTASEFGPQNHFSRIKLASDFRIYPTERANFYVATRQFNRAIDVLESVLKTPGQMMDSPHEQLQALRKYLALEVRVKKDPARAASLVESFLTQKNLPYFVASDAETWLRSLRQWQHEKPSENSRALFTIARRLVQQGRELQAGDSYQGGYVDFLRASALLHESLRTSKSPIQKAKIYQLLGTSYSILASNGMWDLPEFYFEACVRSAPKTVVAKVCYRDFERAVVLGYSGSAGIFVPKEEQARMNELRALAGL